MHLWPVCGHSDSVSTRSAVTLLLFCLVSIFFGCTSGSSVPTANDARPAVEQRAARDSKGLVKLVSLRKTNGQMLEGMGAKAYKLEYTADIEFQGECIFGDGRRMDGNADFAVTPGRVPLFGGGKPKNKGDTASVNGFVMFEQTEKGWRSVRQ